VSWNFNVNGTLFFRANDGTTGIELWTSDGTDAGTTRVKDISLGGGSSSPFPVSLVYSSGHEPLRFSNGRFLFGANDGSTGTEPWISNGTESGTQRINDNNPNLGDGYLVNFT